MGSSIDGNVMSRRKDRFFSVVIASVAKHRFYDSGGTAM